MQHKKYSTKNQNAYKTFIQHTYNNKLLQPEKKHNVGVLGTGLEAFRFFPRYGAKSHYLNWWDVIPY